jgi:NAD(P)H dehydrogenase (quinone)
LQFPSAANDPEAAGNGLVPRLTNVSRMLGISTYGASRTIAFLAGDNGRNCIGTAIRPNFKPGCTCQWMGLYDMDFVGAEARAAFLADVRRTIRDEF